MKKVIWITMVCVMLISVSAYGLLTSTTSSTEDYCVYVTVKPYEYVSTGFCWYAKIQVKDYSTLKYLYCFEKDKTKWNTYFEQNDFSTFQLTGGTSDTHASSIYWKGWTQADDYSAAMGWALNAAHIIMKKIQDADKTVSLSISKLKMIDNNNKVYTASSPVTSGAAPVIEKADRVAYISQVLTQPYYRWNSINEETITDNVTDLMWTSSGSITKETYQGAKDYCESLTYGGYDDWYLPDAKEFMTIIDYKHKLPAIVYAGFTLITADNYWTSTEVDAETNLYVNTRYGTISSCLKTNTAYFLCVREN